MMTAMKLLKRLAEDNTARSTAPANKKQMRRILGKTKIRVPRGLLLRVEVRCTFIVYGRALVLFDCFVTPYFYIMHFQKSTKLSHLAQ